MTTPLASGRGRCMAARPSTLPIRGRPAALAALALAAALAAPAAHAGPADYVASPIVEEGEREIDFKAGSARLGDGNRVNAQSLGFGLGVNAHWFTEVYAKWHGDSANGHSFDAFEWENRFQLTEQGRYPVDVGFLVELERPQDHTEGWELKWGPLLQAEFGAWLGNLNLLVEKHYRAAEAAPAELTYQWQLRRPVAERLELGVQGFGNLGRWDRWAPRDEQEHLAGPAVFGKVALGGRQAIKWNAGWLLGLSDASAKHTLRVQAEYEF